MVITAVFFWHFALGAAALVLRFLSAPLRRCTSACTSCFSCFCSLSRNRAPATDEKLSCGRKTFQIIMALLQRVRPRWYWFHLAVQAGFLIRESCIIYTLSEEGILSWQVAIAHGSIWLTFLIISWECWRFSTVRDMALSPEPIDQILDMLLLPGNYGFLTSLCVRLLSQGSAEARDPSLMASLLESADVWEAWALWSVLEIFVRVVEVTSRRDPQRGADAEYQEAMKAFKVLSRQGVTAWVFLLVCTIVFSVLMKGVLPVFAPTACYSFLQECKSCRAWYHENIEIAAGSVLFILCTFALVFVITFERLFKEYLRAIRPFWKFMGVKSVVSITYFQYMFIRFVFQKTENELYLLQALLCSIEMPILSIFHVTCAYPYGEPWMYVILDTAMGADAERRLLQSPGQIELEEQQKSLDNSLRELQRQTTKTAVEIVDVDTDDAMSASSQAQYVDRSNSILAKKLLNAWSITLFLLSCAGATKMVFVLVPAEVETNSETDVQYWGHSWYCHESLNDFVGSREDMKWAIPAEVQTRNSAGLALCDNVHLSCSRGYSARREKPISVTCKPNGEYAFTGQCYPAACSDPPAFPNGVLKHSSEDDVVREGWSQGMVAKYICDEGFHGGPTAECGKEQIGKWSKTGFCKEVVCQAPQGIKHAKPLVNDSELANVGVRMGGLIRYQCDAGFKGNPVATCTEQGLYQVSGSCDAECNEMPPDIPHAVLHASVRRGKPVTTGEAIKYQCQPSWGGSTVAVCGEDGKFEISGECVKVCGPPFDVEHARSNFVHLDAARYVWTVGKVVNYQCFDGYGGKPILECKENGNWKLEPKTGCEYNSCGPIKSEMLCWFAKAGLLVICALLLYLGLKNRWRRRRLAADAFRKPAAESLAPKC